MLFESARAVIESVVRSTIKGMVGISILIVTSTHFLRVYISNQDCSCQPTDRH